jgi:hypothetical protein
MEAPVACLLADVAMQSIGPMISDDRIACEEIPSQYWRNVFGAHLLCNSSVGDSFAATMANRGFVSELRIMVGVGEDIY